MLDSQSTTGRHSLQPANNLMRRSFPALQLEIGEDEADLLLQFDHWITYEGYHGWIKTSSTIIQRRAFPTWSERKISGVINRMAEKGLILLANQVWPVKDQYPMVALNYEILQTLVSLEITYPAEIAEGPQKLRRDPAEIAEGPQKLRRGPQKLRSESLYIYKSLEEDRVKKSEAIEEGERETEGAAAATRNRFDEEEKNLSPSFTEFALALANICNLDYDLNREKVKASAQVLWEAGYHDPEDLFQVKRWWFKYDWRGQKNSPPHPSQIAEVIKQALDQPESAQHRQRRQHWHDLGIDPNSEQVKTYEEYATRMYGQQLVDFFNEIFGFDMSDEFYNMEIRRLD